MDLLMPRILPTCASLLALLLWLAALAALPGQGAEQGHQLLLGRLQLLLKGAAWPGQLGRPMQESRCGRSCCCVAMLHCSEQSQRQLLHTRCRWSIECAYAWGPCTMYTRCLPC